MTEDLDLTASWQELTGTLGVPDAASREAYTDLCRRYGESSRFYHTLSHVAQMLRTVEDWSRLGNDADLNALRLAAWFHDAVYDSRAKDNEEQSARLAHATLASWGFGDAALMHVERLILATKTHELDQDDPSGALLLDADLAILGRGPAEYTAYSRAIRQEFAWVSEEDYRAGRGRVLRGFLERPTIYRTPPLRDIWEAQARENLRAEMAHLSSPLPL